MKDTDAIARYLLVKHAFMYELGNQILKKGKGNYYEDIPIPIKDVEKSLIENPELEATEIELDPIVASLQIEDFIKFDRSLIIKVTPKGMTAIITGFFLQRYEDRKRDLLQAELASTTNHLNTVTMPKSLKTQRNQGRWALILAVISSAFIALSWWNDSNDKTEKRIQELKIELSQSRETLKSIQVSLKDLNSSIQKVHDGSLNNP